MRKNQEGYAFILPVIIVIILVVLGIGSFIYTHPGFSLYSLFNIGSGKPVAEGPQSISINKDEFVTGEILVAFKEGTTYANAKAIFAKYDITTYENLMWRSSGKVGMDSDKLSSIDIFVVNVSPGLENEIVTKLKGEPLVISSTLNYSGAN